MSKKGKLLARLLLRPKDFSYSELKSLLNGMNYEEFNKGRTSGSRVAFINKKTSHIIRLHKPHPKNILKSYQIDLIVDELKKRKLNMKKDYLEYKGFHGTVHYSSEDSIFFGKVSGINDLVTFEGSSVKELQRSFKEAVEDYLEICIAKEKPVLKSMKGSFNVRITPELHQRVAKASVMRGISLNQFIQKAIEFTLNDEKYTKVKNRVPA